MASHARLRHIRCWLALSCCGGTLLHSRENSCSSQAGTPDQVSRELRVSNTEWNRSMRRPSLVREASNSERESVSKGHGC